MTDSALETWRDDAAAGSVPFSEAIRTGTRQVHEEAETSDFMARMLDGQVPLEGYAALAAEHWVIYGALEETAARLAADPVVAAFLDPALERLPALEADLAVLVGPDFRGGIAPSAAAHAYADRIRGCASWPGGFVAHHYTRHLGDLSGGLALGRILARTYGLVPGEDGLRFYDFRAIPKPKPYKDAYRHALDILPLSTGERERVVEEARVAFRHNAAVFADLGRRFSATG